MASSNPTYGHASFYAAAARAAASVAASSAPVVTTPPPPPPPTAPPVPDGDPNHGIGGSVEMTTTTKTTTKTESSTDEAGPPVANDATGRSWSSRDRNRWSTLESELASLDPARFPETRAFLQRALQRRKDKENPEFVHLGENHVKLVQKVFVPTHLDPTFNYGGKILGPKGLHVKEIFKNTGVRIMVMGKGSSKGGPEEESRLLASGEPQHAHLAAPLHVRFESSGSLAEAWSNLQEALSRLAPYMYPTGLEPNRLNGGGGDFFGGMAPAWYSGGEEVGWGSAHPLRAPSSFGKMRGRGGRGGFYGGGGGGGSFYYGGFSPY